MERWPEDFLRLNLDPNRGGNVALRPRLNNGEHPSLVLKGSGQAKDLRRPIIASHADIGQRPTPGNKLLADLLVAEIDMHAIARGKPVVTTSLRSLSVAANPASYQ